ncbi:hypothetical protein [Lacinutrix salivirga]
MYKILKIVVAILALLGVVFLVRVLMVGDTSLQDAYAAGEQGMVDGYFNPIAWLAYAILGIILFFVVVFILKNLFSSPATLKKTLINVGAFLLLFAIAYFVFAKGIEKPMRDGEVLSAAGDKMVGAGLYLFYFLSVIAVGLMVASGVKKLIK